MTIEILNLREEPTHLDQICQWHHLEWSYLNPTNSLEHRKNTTKLHLQEKAIPTTYIAKVDGELAGSAAIIESDMDTHPEYTPWLASVYVCEKFRNRGIGATLIKQITNHANLHNIDTLYLYTPSEEHFYKKLGWQTLSHENYHNYPVTIMSIETSRW